MPHDVESFQAVWSRFHGALPPMGHVLRRAAQTPWVRLHALPGSRRYARDAAERQEILRRANILGTEVLAPGADCFLVQSHIEGGHPPFVSSCRVFARATHRFLDPDDDDMTWIAEVAVLCWQEGCLDDLLMARADDETGPTLLMNCGNGAVFAPYDGGFDLFSPSRAEIDHLAQRHAEWLPTHPSGL